MSNILKWNRWHDNRDPKCVTCGLSETLIHPFVCDGNLQATRSVMSIVEDVLPIGISLEGFFVNHLVNPTARSLSTELMHQIWRARCARVYEGCEVSNDKIFRRTISRFLEAVNTVGKPSLFKTRRFVATGDHLDLVD